MGGRLVPTAQSAGRGAAARTWGPSDATRWGLPASPTSRRRPWPRGTRRRRLRRSAALRGARGAETGAEDPGRSETMALHRDPPQTRRREDGDQPDAGRAGGTETLPPLRDGGETGSASRLTSRRRIGGGLHFALDPMTTRRSALREPAGVHTRTCTRTHAHMRAHTRGHTHLSREPNRARK